ncbi:MAG TPA: hypothetical protein PLI74_01315 [Candidatus Kapabacteria bacterium]|nr:hypothetical protein [Candidatus Kapabacteria bacterium]
MLNTDIRQSNSCFGCIMVKDIAIGADDGGITAAMIPLASQFVLW